VAAVPVVDWDAPAEGELAADMPIPEAVFMGVVELGVLLHAASCSSPAAAAAAAAVLREPRVLNDMEMPL